MQMYTTAQKLRHSTKQEHHRTKDSISTKVQPVAMSTAVSGNLTQFTL